MNRVSDTNRVPINQKVRARYEATPTLSTTLESLVANEQGEKKRVATEGLLWLLRGLSFTCKALENAQANASEELSAAFTKSYENTLKKFHNFVVKGIFAVRSQSRISDATMRSSRLLIGGYESLSIPCGLLCQTCRRPFGWYPCYSRKAQRGP